MSLFTTAEVIYLGNFADADTNESTIVAENPSIFSGVFGSAGDPLYTHEVLTTFEDVNHSGGIETNNLSGEPISYDLGAGTVNTVIDALASVNLTVTYMDGSSASYSNVVMYQDVTGNLFLTNSNWGGISLNTSSLIQSINVTNVNSTNYNVLLNNDLREFACYGAGTKIRTNNGDVQVEDLSVGDLVLTQDHGFQPIFWIKGETVRRTVQMTPIRITAGALGSGLPVTDLLISQNHRILVRSQKLERLVNEAEVYVAAKKLVDLPGIEFDTRSGPMTYFHLMCEQHEIIFAEGAPSETLFPGKQALAMIGPDAAKELLSIFPSLAQRNDTVALARKELKGGKLRKLIARHLRNPKDLLPASPIFP